MLCRLVFDESLSEIGHPPKKGGRDALPSCTAIKPVFGATGQRRVHAALGDGRRDAGVRHGDDPDVVRVPPGRAAVYGRDDVRLAFEGVEHGVELERRIGRPLSTILARTSTAAARSPSDMAA